MAGKRQRENGTWEYKFQRKGLLERPVYFTFDDTEEGDLFAERIDELLDRGVVPAELSGGVVKTLGELINRYELVTVSQSDHDQIRSVRRRVESVRLAQFHYTWVEGWVEGMRSEGMAPSTITKNVGMLARCVDWALRRELLSLPANPLRLLPRGYASKGREEKTWVGERDRRLSGDGVEEGAIRKVLSKEREHSMMFDMALETAMRMRETYTLTADQVRLDQNTIFLDKTKNGDKRQVPISSVLKKLLCEYLVGVGEDARLFPSLWDGKTDMKSLKATTNRVSKLFKTRFEKAGANDLHYHDLRHEATARIYERTTLSDVEVASITGHKDPRMLKRYANLRGSSLASRLW